MIGKYELLIIAVFLIIPIIALLDILRNQFKGNDKLVWVILVLIIPLIGSILYFIIGVKQKIRE